MKTKIVILLLIAFTLSHTYCRPKSTTHMNVVKNVDIVKYAGTWYEIARFPHRFEKNLVGVTATYTLTDGKFIKVLNQGYKNTLNGKHKKAKGKAYIPDKNNQGHLRVSFFLCFYADYFILELDETDYQYALVGSSTMNYLWILSRTPKMEEGIYQMLVEKAKLRGYDISKLELVEQKDI